MPGSVDVAIAVDPGRGKCGVAVVDASGALGARLVVDTSALSGTIRALCESRRPQVILVGDGTGSSAVLETLRALDLGPPIVPVDERHTSEAARARYLVETPARGWRRLIPRSLRTPEEPYDDWVAVILAERWWRSRAESTGGAESRTRSV